MRQLTEREEKSFYAIGLEHGLDFAYGKLSLIDLANHKHSQIYKNRRWQVHCDDNRVDLFSKVYHDKVDAIEKFMEIKKKVPLRNKL